jgi:hypothetical protein
LLKEQLSEIIKFQNNNDLGNIADNNNKPIIASITVKNVLAANFSQTLLYIQVSDAVSLKMRVKETNEETKEERWVWKESTAVCLMFRIKELPPHVYFCYNKIEVSTFVAAVQQC